METDKCPPPSPPPPPPHHHRKSTASPKRGGSTPPASEPAVARESLHPGFPANRTDNPTGETGETPDPEGVEIRREEWRPPAPSLAISSGHLRAGWPAAARAGDEGGDGAVAGETGNIESESRKRVERGVRTTRQRTETGRIELVSLTSDRGGGRPNEAKAEPPGGGGAGRVLQ